MMKYPCGNVCDYGYLKPTILICNTCSKNKEQKCETNIALKKLAEERKARKGDGN